MKEKKSVVILFGGLSSEHEVSCNSAASIIDNIDTALWDIHKVGITKDGKWILTDAAAEEIKTGRWYDHDSNQNVTLSLNRLYSGLVELETGNILKVDCIFPVLHGAYGEDGTIQGVCEIAGIPYVGCDVAASACSIDKVLTKKIVNGTNVRQAKYITFNRGNGCDIEEQVETIDQYFSGKYPLFVKPATEGSSVGISKVDGKEEMGAALKTAYQYDPKILIEEGIVGREIEVAVLGNEELLVSKIGEILVENGFYSYDSKYGNNADHVVSAKTRIITDLNDALVSEIQENAKTVYRELACSGLARVDFFLTKENEIIFNEINTMPGFTDISMYPKLMNSIGVAYDELISMLIKNAILEG